MNEEYGLWDKHLLVEEVKILVKENTQLKQDKQSLREYINTRIIKLYEQINNTKDDQLNYRGVERDNLKTKIEAYQDILSKLGE